MENHRLLLYFTLFFVMYMLWAQWQQDYGPKDAPAVVTQQAEPRVNTAIEDDIAVPEPAAASSTSGSSSVSSISTTAASSDSSASDSQIIEVTTDVFKVKIDTRGGDIIETVLLDYAYEADKPEEKMSLLTDARVNFHIAQSGLVSANKESAPTHKSVFTASQSHYDLQDQEQVVVPLSWRSNEGTSVTKTYTFTKGSYVIDMDYAVSAGNNGWNGSEYMQLVRNTPDTSRQSKFIHTYTGGVVYNDEIKYEKVTFDDIREDGYKQELKDGWLAMIQHYFLAAWIPQSGSNNLYYTRYDQSNDYYVLGVRTDAMTLGANENGELSARLVVGPKLQYELEKIEKGLELTVDYGVLTILAKPLFWLLNFFHNWTGNWGIAIILLTVTVKALFFKLSEMSYRSMAKMRNVAPRIKQMKERFGDDRQGMSKAMMDMYKREKINPLGGCFPILVQIPVFIALYWTVLESVEMRHAPFAFWLTNLSAKDPYFVLPVIMGISMFVQQKLNPAPIDPVQQKVFQIMPFAFTLMFAFFPSGLVLYWVVNNILSITQQWFITRSIEKAA